jgi:hypothetical protein
MSHLEGKQSTLQNSRPQVGFERLAEGFNTAGARLQLLFDSFKPGFEIPRTAEACGLASNAQPPKQPGHLSEALSSQCRVLEMPERHFC